MIIKHQPAFRGFEGKNYPDIYWAMDRTRYELSKCLRQFLPQYRIKLLPVKKPGKAEIDKFQYDLLKEMGVPNG